MAASDFVLNTRSMDTSAKSCQDLAEKMKTLKDELDTEKNNILFNWEGKGCNEFEKQFRLLVQQLSDITDNLWETGEKILTAEQDYIQADTNAAKALDGVTKGEITRGDKEISNVYGTKDKEISSVYGTKQGGGGGSW